MLEEILLKKFEQKKLEILAYIIKIKNISINIITKYSE